MSYLHLMRLWIFMSWQVCGKIERLAWKRFGRKPGSGSTHDAVRYKLQVNISETKVKSDIIKKSASAETKGIFSFRAEAAMMASGILKPYCWRIEIVWSITSEVNSTLWQRDKKDFISSDSERVKRLAESNSISEMAEKYGMCQA